MFDGFYGVLYKTTLLNYEILVIKNPGFSLILRHLSIRRKLVQKLLSNLDKINFDEKPISFKMEFYVAFYVAKISYILKGKDFKVRTVQLIYMY